MELNSDLMEYKKLMLKSKALFENLYFQCFYANLGKNDVQKVFQDSLMGVYTSRYKIDGGLIARFKLTTKKYRATELTVAKRLKKKNLASRRKLNQQKKIKNS